MLPIATTDSPVDDPLLKVRVQFCTDTSGIRYELVAPHGEGSPVTGALARGTNILNHVAYEVDDLNAAAGRLREQGAMPLGPALPAIAFGGRRVMFFLTQLRFVVELVERIGPSPAIAK